MSKDKKKEKSEKKDKKEKIERAGLKISVTFIEEDVSVEVREGALLKKAFKKAEIKKKYPCDKGKCGKCKVLVRTVGDEEWKKSLPCVDQVDSPLEVMRYKKEKKEKKNEG